MPSLIDYIGLVVTPTSTPAPGDLVMRGLSGGWTTQPVGVAPPGSSLVLGSDGLPKWGTPMVTSLPTPSIIVEGSIVILSGASSNRDVPYVCVGVPGGTYEWDRISLSLTYTIGDGVNHLFTLAHYLGHQNPLVTVVNTSTHQEEYPDITFTDAQHVAIEFGSANVPASNAYTVRVVG